MERSSKKAEAEKAEGPAKTDGNAGSKKAEKGAAAAEAITLEQLILDKKEGKYGIVALISFWAKELRKQEENRHMTQTDLLEKAMADVLSGGVSSDTLEKRMMESGAKESQEEAPSFLGPVKKASEKKSASSED